MEDSKTPTPGAILREARQRARLSQTDVAERAHVAQSVVSAYEGNRRSPSLATLSRLVEATGHQLVLGLERDEDVPPGLPDTPLGRRLRHHRKATVACAARYGASNVRVFGSVARGEDRPDSDIDLVVDLAPGTGLFSLEHLRRELTDLLGTAVDVVPSDSLRPRVRREVERDAVPL
jgi:uncharacterized protein